MVKIIWKGEADEANDIPGPSWNTWNGIRFPRGQPVEISDPGMIASARQNQFYIVEEEASPVKPREKTHEASQDQSQEQEAEPPSLEQKAQELKERLERKEQKKDYDYREAEKVSGYAPKKKKGRPKKSGSNPGMATPDT